VINNTLSSD